MLKPNNFGKYKKQDIINAGYKILNVSDGYTATDIKAMLGVMLTREQREKYAIGYVCEKSYRGCAPVFDLEQIMQLIANNELA